MRCLIGHDLASIDSIPHFLELVRDKGQSLDLRVHTYNLATPVLCVLFVLMTLIATVDDSGRFDLSEAELVELNMSPNLAEMFLAHLSAHVTAMPPTYLR